MSSVKKYLKQTVKRDIIEEGWYFRDHLKEVEEIIWEKIVKTEVLLLAWKKLQYDSLQSHSCTEER